MLYIRRWTRSVVRCSSARVVALATCGLLLGCGQPGDATGSETAPTSAGTTAHEGTTAATTAGSSAGSGSDATQAATGGGATETGAPEPKFDVGDDPSGTNTGAASGCQKADFLFVVDNSGSMSDEQANLIASFPGFIATITQTLDAQDFHIMAVSTDNGEDTGLSNMCGVDVCNCTPAPACCAGACKGSVTTCSGFDCSDLPVGPCDYVYGGGKVYDATGESCELADDRRYMLSSQPDIEQTFECVANVGTYGSGKEKPMLAASAAISDAMVANGGCNEGFLRDDAILVLTFITDEDDVEDDNGSPGDPADWYNTLVALKNGDADAVVVLGLLGDSNLPNGLCPADVDPQMDGAAPAPRLQSFVDMFANGVIGSVCAPDYTPFFVDAVSVIDLACDSFEPPE